jgi:hypothetical protein
VGLGMLQRGHRFWEYAKNTTGNELELPLGPISSELCELVETCEECSKLLPDYYPVADIANHLFFVEPNSDSKLPTSSRKT